MTNAVKIRMSSGKEYEVNLNAPSYNLQAIVDEVYEDEFFILEREGQRPILLAKTQIESIDLI